MTIATRAREAGASRRAPAARPALPRSAAAEAAALRLAGAALLFGLAAVASAGPARAATTARVSVGTGGAQGDLRSGAGERPALSADGRYVAFVSEATNLVPGDTNGAADAFVRDRRTGETRRVSVGPDGAQADAASGGVALSADGRFVAFASNATNLVPGDTNGETDLFVHDLATAVTERASLGPGGVEANGFSSHPSLSADGRLVAFVSVATNLVPGDTNGTGDVFVRDRRTGAVRRASLGSSGAEANGGSANPALSADGRLVAFNADATNLVAGDANGENDVFVRDLAAGTTRRVSVGPGGVGGNGSSFGGLAISADGRLVAFDSFASNLVRNDTNGTSDVFVRDLATGQTRRASVRTGGGQVGKFSASATISADGRFVAFHSRAGNLVPGDTNGRLDVFVRDLAAGTTVRASVGTGGGQGDGQSFFPALSADGRVAAFVSAATNLVPGDTNGVEDVFVRAR